MQLMKIKSEITCIVIAVVVLYLKLGFINKCRKMLSIFTKSLNKK